MTGPPEEWDRQERSTDEILGRVAVTMRMRGNRSIARALRRIADESQRGTLIALAARFDQGEDLIAVGVFSELVDPETLNLPGEIRVISGEKADSALIQLKLDKTAPRDVLEGVVPARGLAEDEDTDVVVVREKPNGDR